MQNMGKVSHNVFKAVIDELLEELPIIVESGSEVYHLIPKSRYDLEVTR